MKGPSFAEVAAAKLREAHRLVRLQRSYDAECVASDAKAGRWMVDGCGGWRMDGEVGSEWLIGMVD